MASRYLPSGLGPPIIRVGEHMSKKRGRSASAWDSSVHRPVTFAMTRRPSNSSRSSNASSVTVWVTSASTCCSNRQASSVFGAQSLPIFSMVRHSLTMDVVSAARICGKA